MRFTIPNLQPNTTYGVQLAFTDGETVSSYSRKFIFTTQSNTDIPATPGGLQWIAVADTFHAEWNPVITTQSGAELLVIGYEVELVAGGNTRIVSVNQNTTGPVTFDLSFEQNMALFGTARPQIQIRVRAVDSHNLKSSWAGPLIATNPAPGPPLNAVVVETVNSVSISWTPPPLDQDLIGYRVYASTTPGFVPSSANLVWSGSATRMTFTSLTSQLHYFIIRAVDKFNQESSDLTAQGTPGNPFGSDTEPPTNASNFIVSPGFSAVPQRSFVDALWTASPSDDVQNYVIRYSTDGINWQFVSAPADTTSLRIDNLSPNALYYFSIKTVDFSANESTYLNASPFPVTTSADTLAPSTPAPPVVVANAMQIQVTASGLKADLSTPMESDTRFYEVYASTVSGFLPLSSNMLGSIFAGPASVQVFDVPASSSSGLTQTWYVRLIAVDTSGNRSSASAETQSQVGLISTGNIADLAVTNAKIQTLDVNKITAGSGVVTDWTIKSDLTIGDSLNQGSIKSFNYVQNLTGWKIDQAGVEINNGLISGAALKIQDGQNLMPSEFASFEFPAAFYGNPENVGADNFANVIISTDTNIRKIEGQSLRAQVLAGSPQIYLGTTGIGNVSVSETAGNAQYIISFYVYASVSSTITLFWGTSSDAGNIVMFGGSQSFPTTINTWVRHQQVVTLNSNAFLSGRTQLSFRFGATGNFYIDGVQFERVQGASTTASPFKRPTATSISGDMIKTGRIHSVNPALDVSGNIIPGLWAWDIDVDGDATLGNVMVRGSMVVGTQADDDEDHISVIQSHNYAPGTTGWMIRSDGTSEFRQMQADSIHGDSIIADTLSINKLSANDPLVNTIEVQGSLFAQGNMGERVEFGGTGFQVLGPYEVNITTASLTSNIVTITTAVPHGFVLGNEVYISGVSDTTFNSPIGVPFTIATIPSSTTFTYALTAANASSSGGLAQSYSTIQGTGSGVGRPVLIDFPTNATRPNIISGDTTTGTLTVTGGAAFQDDSVIERAARFLINNNITAPKKAPTVVASYTTVPNPAGSSLGENRGAAPDFATGNYYYVGYNVSGTNVVKEFDASNNYVATRVQVSTSGGLLRFIGITYSPDFDRYYVGKNRVNLATATQFYEIDTYDGSWNLLNTFTWQTIGNGLVQNWTVGYDHVVNALLVAYHNGTNLLIRRLTLNTGGIPTVVGTPLTVAAGANALNNPRFIARVNNADGQALDRFYIKNYINGTITATSVTSNVIATSTAGALQTGEYWPTPAGNTVGGWYNETTGKFHNVYAGGWQAQFESGDSWWNSTSSTAGKRYIGYSWYDANATGGTHETNLSPRATLSLPKRSKMNVSITPIPTGLAGTDDPGYARIYVAAGATEPELTTPSTAWHLRETIQYPQTSTNIVPVATPTGAQPKNNATNEFAALAATPGSIETTSGLTFIKGNDTAQFQSVKFGSASQRVVTKIDFGSFSGLQVAGGDGDLTISHNLGTTPVHGSIRLSTNGGWRQTISTLNSTTIIAQIRHGDTNTLAPNGETFSGSYMVIA